MITQNHHEIATAILVHLLAADIAAALAALPPDKLLILLAVCCCALWHGTRLSKHAAEERNSELARTAVRAFPVGRPALFYCNVC